MKSALVCMTQTGEVVVFVGMLTGRSEESRRNVNKDVVVVTYFGSLLPL